MRWERLFDDLEAQMASAERLGNESEVAERVRADQGSVSLSDRLRGQGIAPLDVLLRGGLSFRGRVAQLGDGWLALESAPFSVLIPLPAVVRIAGLGRTARTEESAVRRSMSLASCLRVLARDRAVVTCSVDAGMTEPSQLSGTIDGVGRDYLEISTREDSGLRAAQTTQRAVVPFTALVAVRSGG